MLMSNEKVKPYIFLEVDKNKILLYILTNSSDWIDRNFYGKIDLFIIYFGYHKNAFDVLVSVVFRITLYSR